MRPGLDDCRSSQGILLAQAVFPFFSCQAALIMGTSAGGCSTVLAAKASHEGSAQSVYTMPQPARLAVAILLAHTSCSSARPRRVGANVDGDFESRAQIGQTQIGQTTRRLGSRDKVDRNSNNLARPSYDIPV